MPRSSLVRIAALAPAAAAVLALCGPAAAQNAPQRGPLIIEVRPQGWLDPPNVSVPYSLPGSMQRYAVTQTFVSRPSRVLPQRERFGEAVLPDPLGAGRSPIR